MSTKRTMLAKAVDFAHVKNLDAGVVLVDVREPKELQQCGVIPNSINIPLGKVEDAFKNLTDAEFLALYKAPKPAKDAAVIFSCKAGVRSAKAMKIAEEVGYNNTSNYQGGFDDWAQQTKSTQ